MFYRATDVASYIINRCYNEGNPVSNLKLQKILYFVWVDYYRKTNCWLFMDNICAWQFGPVVPEIYYEFCSYAGRPICTPLSSYIEDSDQPILNEIIDKYINMPVNTLVNKTHRRGTAWDIIYRNGDGNREPIPFDLIIQKECGGTRNASS